MLLVHDHEREVLELHALLDEGVCTYDDVGPARGYLFEGGPPFRRALGARQETTLTGRLARAVEIDR